MEHAPDTLAAVLVLLASAVVAVTLLRRFHLPAILGYLAVGIAVGPNGLGWVPDVPETRVLAEFGVVFLLFTVGLEFSLPQLVAMRAAVLGLGGAQVALTAAIVALAANAWGASWTEAAVLGGALAMSSTAIVTKQLAEQLELASRHGRLAVGVLLFQDLAVIPFLILVPALAGTGADGMLAQLGWAFAKGLLVVAALLAAGHWLLRPLFQEVASARSAELFTLTVLLVTLGAAWLTHRMGLSPALGAFLAGMMLSETEYRHQVEADIRPFRDVLLGLFFVTVGMLLDPRALPDRWAAVALTTAGLVAGKAMLVYLLARAGRHEPGVALRTALVLAQGGEFGFALLALALRDGVLGETAGQVALTSIVLSMLAAPLLIRHNGAIAKRLFPRSYVGRREASRRAIAEAARGLSGHVIVCGFGRVGQNVARFLEREGFAYFALDLDPGRVREAREAGEPVHYGDSTHPEILEAAGLARAAAVVVTYDDPPAALRVVQAVRKLHPDLPVLVRTRDDADLERLQAAGATEVVPETLEASLMLVSHLLLLLGVPVSRVVRRVRAVREDRYRLLRSFFHGQEPEPIDTGAFRERLHAVPLPEGAHAVGRRLRELALDKAGVEVAAIRRGERRGPPPRGDTRLEAGDVVVLYGAPEELERAEALLLKG